MSLRPSIFLVIIVLFSSCNNQKTSPSSITKSPIKPHPLNCFRYAHNRDTIILKTIAVNGFITGTLVYNFYQKDKNTGTIQGQMKGDLLIADYKFHAEGVLSVRQVVFKKEASTFIEGYGETTTINDKTIFKNIAKLNFSDPIILTEIDCEK